MMNYGIKNLKISEIIYVLLFKNESNSSNRRKNGYGSLSLREYVRISLMSMTVSVGNVWKICGMITNIIITNVRRFIIIKKQKLRILVVVDIKLLYVHYNSNETGFLIFLHM